MTSLNFQDVGSWRREPTSGSSLVVRMSSEGQLLVCKCTKFRKDTSIHGRVITTSGLEKRSATILKFYFQFRLWPISRHRHLILHRNTKFSVNRTISGLAMTLCQSSRWRTSAMLYFIYNSGGPPTTCRWWCEFRHQILDWSDVRYCAACDGGLADRGNGSVFLRVVYVCVYVWRWCIVVKRLNYLSRFLVWELLCRNSIGSGYAQGKGDLPMSGMLSLETFRMSPRYDRPS